MALQTPQAHFRETLLIILGSLALIVAGFWFAFQYVEPAPPTHIKIAKGSTSGAYHAFAQQYARHFEKAGIKLELVESAGSKENLQRLANDKSETGFALVQGGVAGPAAKSNLVSLGRVFLEPMWVFYRADKAIDRLGLLKGKRLAIGREGSGTRVLAEVLLKANNLGPQNTGIISEGGQRAATALLDGSLDAIFLVMSPKAKIVRELLVHPDVRLLSMRHGEAYTRLFSYLSRVTLPAGVIDLIKQIPPRDVTLVAAQAALVARDDVHPALVGLMVQAAIKTHKGGGMFQQVDEFPKAHDPELPFSEDAERMYKSGVSFLRRMLPFWLATLIERMLVMIVPIATILIPMFKLVPMAFDWRVRQRINYWYRELKDLEKVMKADLENADGVSHRSEIERIEDAVSSISVPLRYSDSLYELRAAVDLVRQRVAQRGV